MRLVALVATGLLFAGCGTSDGAGAPTEAPTDSTAPTSPVAVTAGDTVDPASTTTDTVVATVATVAAAPTTEPVITTVTDARGVDVTVTSVDRVIPLDGDLAEIVFALGMGDHVVATDLSATYPPEADALPQIGYQRALDVEPILDFEPTLLLATDVAGPPETIEGLERVGVPLVVIPTEPTPEGPAEKIMAVARALGVEDRGAELAAGVQSEIDGAIADRPPLDPPPRVAVLYVRGTNTQLVMGSDYGIHWLVEAAGGTNVADELGITDTAPITAEAILAAAPDVLIVPQAGLESVGGIDGLLAANPALAETPAGALRAVLAYDDQLMLGNGPRTGQFLATLIADLAAAAGDQPTGDTP